MCIFCPSFQCHFCETYGSQVCVCSPQGSTDEKWWSPSAFKLPILELETKISTLELRLQIFFCQGCCALLQYLYDYMNNCEEKKKF